MLELARTTAADAIWVPGAYTVLTSPAYAWVPWATGSSVRERLGPGPRGTGAPAGAPAYLPIAAPAGAPG